MQLQAGLREQVYLALRPLFQCLMTEAAISAAIDCLSLQFGVASNGNFGEKTQFGIGLTFSSTRSLESLWLTWAPNKHLASSNSNVVSS